MVFLFHLYFPYHFTRISNSNNIIGNILCYHRTSTNGYVVANGNAGKNHYIATKPNIIANLYGVRILYFCISFLRVDGMPNGIKGTIRSNINIVAKRYLRFVQYNKVRIGKELLAYFYIEAIVAKERLDYSKPTSSLA